MNVCRRDEGIVGECSLNTVSVYQIASQEEDKFDESHVRRKRERERERDVQSIPSETSE